jgi:hypothetical protein
MKIKIHQDYGFAGTDSSWEEEIPEDVVAEGQEEIDSYIRGLTDEIFENMMEKLNLSIEVQEEE